MRVVKALLAWFVLLVLMIGNGILRVNVLQPRLGEAAARQVASLTGVAIILAFSHLFVRWQAGATRRQLLQAGGLWLALTIVFEFLFGHYVSGMSWQALLADYNIFRGRLWPLILLAALLGPWLWGFVLSRPKRSGGAS